MSRHRYLGGVKMLCLSPGICVPTTGAAHSRSESLRVTSPSSQTGHTTSRVTSAESARGRTKIAAGDSDHPIRVWAGTRRAKRNNRRIDHAYPVNTQGARK